MQYKHKQYKYLPANHLQYKRVIKLKTNVQEYTIHTTHTFNTLKQQYVSQCVCVCLMSGNFRDDSPEDADGFRLKTSGFEQPYTGKSKNANNTSDNKERFRNFYYFNQL